MKNLLHITLFSTVICFAFSSCVKETARGDAFEASFTLDTETISDGEEFGFTIKCNRNEFNIVSFDCPLAPGLLEPHTVCRTQNGVWSLCEKVSVPQSQRGRIILSIEDPETGLVKEFSAFYTAYASSGLSLLIENEAISSKYFSEGLPTVVSGDDFLFTLHSKAERLILKDFISDFNDGSLFIGREFHFTDENSSIRIPKVQTEDCFTPKTLSLTLLNPDTGRDTSLTASYVTAAAFTPRITLSSPILYEGERVAVRFTSNRPLFHLKEYVGPSWFVLEDYSPDKSELTTGMDGFASLSSEPLQIDKNGSGTILFELYDSEYTKRSVVVSVPYNASVKAAPGNISLSATELTVNGSQTASVEVSTTTAHSSGLFTARIISNGDSPIGLYAPAPGENIRMDDIAQEAFSTECSITSGRLYIRGLSGKWGSATVRVYSKDNEKVYKDIQLYVRRDVALRLKGSFFNDICYWPNTIDAIFSDLGSGSEGIGWYGMPRTMEAELVAFENRSSKEITALSKEEVSSWVKCFSLGDGNASRFEVAFVITVGNRVSSNFFYGNYMSHSEPKSRLLTGSGIDRTTSSTRPVSINTTITESAVYGSKINCQRLFRALREMDCNADYQNGYGLFTMLRETKHSMDHLGFGSFDISLSQVKYDRDKYNLCWVMTMYEVPGEWGEAAPWWNEIGGERPWIIPYNK